MGEWSDNEDEEEAKENATSPVKIEPVAENNDEPPAVDLRAPIGLVVSPVHPLAADVESGSVGAQQNGSFFPL